MESKMITSDEQTDYYKNIQMGNIIKFRDMEVGHYCSDLVYIWQSRYSGEVLSESFSPKTPIMRCAHILDGKEGAFEVGSLCEDYFNSDFIYVGDNLEKAKLFLKTLKEVQNKMKDES